MSAVLIFLVSVPLAVEISGRLLGLRDVWWVREARPPALLRLVVPSLILGVTTWWALPDHLVALTAGLALPLVWQLVTGWALRTALRFRGFQTRAVSSRVQRSASD